MNATLIFEKGGLQKAMAVKDMLLGRHIRHMEWAGAESNRSGMNRHLPSVTVIFKLADNPVEYLNCQFSDVCTAD